MKPTVQYTEVVTKAMFNHYLKELYELKRKVRLEAKDLPRLTELRRALEVYRLLK